MIISEVRTTHAGQQRRAGHRIDTIVVHSMAEIIDFDGKVRHASSFMETMGLSCHYMISPKGEIIQCADPHKRTTYHAKGHNMHTIGIEVLVPGVRKYSNFVSKIKTDWTTMAQIDATVELIKWCFENFPIAKCVRHSTLSPRRKIDPGLGFPWEQLQNSLMRVGIKRDLTSKQIRDAFEE